MKNTGKQQTERRALHGGRHLRIHRETLRQLTRNELHQVAGGIQPESRWTECEGGCPRTVEW
jgi:hypothetical protein